MSEALPEVYLARHGETAWTVSGRHTGRTDLPLTDRGERNAANLRDRLRGMVFSRVLVSPLGRARRTCELAGFAGGAEVVPDLTEWDYGAYEGRRTAEIRRERPGWYLLRDGCPGG
jgi:probable phosphoglycerate mutase